MGALGWKRLCRKSRISLTIFSTSLYKNVGINRGRIPIRFRHMVPGRLIFQALSGGYYSLESKQEGSMH
jgi:hypothetical protein